MYLSIAILCAALLPEFFCHEDIHEFMSRQEVQQVFNTDVHTVPEYEVVKVHVSERLHKRGLSSGSRLHTTAFGEKINLWLHPRDSILAGVDTPVYYAKYSESTPEEVEFQRRHGLMKMVGRIFENPSEMASLVIGTDENGNTRVNGHIESRRIAVRSLPQRVIDEYRRRRRSVDEPDRPEHSQYHAVIKMNEDFAENRHQRSPLNETRLLQRLSRSAVEVPDTLYPEILVVVDNSVYKAFTTPNGHDIYGLLEYLLAFWNGVDLKYRSLEAPRFRLKISAIILAQDAAATPYISEFMVTSDAFDADMAFPVTKKFWWRMKNIFPLDSYDIAVTMTRLKFGYSSVMGMASIGTACSRNDRWGTTEGVVLHRDNGVFGGVHIVAHELGHSFGASHDISENCASIDGHLMAIVPWHTANASDFSPCSIEQIQQHIDNQRLTCLYNQPIKHGESLPKLMPGRMKNVDAQCMKQAGGPSCQDRQSKYNVCQDMFCINEEGECVGTHLAALDGTKCGNNNEFCLHQQCVRL